MENLFGKRLKQLRLSKNLGQVEVANSLGVSKSIISLWENGLREPGIKYLKLVCDFFHVSADYLIGRTDKF